MRENLIKASEILEKVVKGTNRDASDYVRMLSLVNQGINPLTSEEISHFTDAKTWANLLKLLKK